MMRGEFGGRRRSVAAVAVFLLAGVVAAATSGPPAVPRVAPEPLPFRVELSPERPVQGTIFTVSVYPKGAGIRRVSGEFAGEPLHFIPGAEAFTALAAVPVDSAGEMALYLEVHGVDGRVERRVEQVVIAPGDYVLEKLTVAPRYGSPYDEATRERIAREAARAREVARRAHGTPRLWEPPFVRPRPSRITSRFGNGREFNGQVQSRHTGTDFAGPIGAPVRAAARGVVRIVDNFFLGGNVVYIDHGAGLVTAYLHLSEATVAVGDTVQAGQEIGKVGATGRVTGPHLHWIVRYGGISVDGLSLPGIEE